METPLSARMVTRSQARNNACGRKEEHEKSTFRSRHVKSERGVLADITNDSPIVGLAMGSHSSALSKNKSFVKQTPGSGEALLRGQVKNLLQKVEEEAELIKPVLEQGNYFLLQSLPKSPVGLLAPTPANTPQVPNLAIDNHISLEKFNVDEALDQEQEAFDSNETPISRALLFDSPDDITISEDSSVCSSIPIHQKSASYHKSSETDDSSIWSLQVNLSSDGDYQEEEIENEEDYNVENQEEEESILDLLCEELGSMGLEEEKQMSVPSGKHTRFIYNEFDEIERAEEVIHLKGVPVSEGKHVRFSEEDDD